MLLICILSFPFLFHTIVCFPWYYSLSGFLFCFLVSWVVFFVLFFGFGVFFPHLFGVLCSYCKFRPKLCHSCVNFFLVHSHPVDTLDSLLFYILTFLNLLSSSFLFHVLILMKCILPKKAIGEVKFLRC